MAHFFKISWLPSKFIAVFGWIQRHEESKFSGQNRKKGICYEIKSYASFSLKF